MMNQTIVPVLVEESHPHLSHAMVVGAGKTLCGKRHYIYMDRDIDAVGCKTCITATTRRVLKGARVDEVFDHLGGKAFTRVDAP